MFQPPAGVACLQAVARSTEITGVAQVREQIGPGRSPPQCFSRAFAGGGQVHAHEWREPFEMRRGLLPRHADNRHAELHADGFGNLPERKAFFGHRMVASAARATFQRQPERTRRIMAVHRRPTVAAIADVRRHAMLTGKRNHAGHEAVVAFAMNRWRKPHHRHRHTFGDELHGRRFRRSRIVVRCGHRFIRFHA